MSLKSRGLIPVADHERIHHSNEPRLRGLAPALFTPLENADQVLNKQVVTINRAGSDTLNPGVKGLGQRFTFTTGQVDRLRSVFIFQDRRALGPNLIASVGSAAPGVFTLDTVMGVGISKAGPSNGLAKRNFIRWSGSFGTNEKEFYLKDKDPDVIIVNGKRVLDDSFLPTALQINQVDVSFPFIQAAIDFFPSWGDAFHVQHNAKNVLLDPGFLKAYGGAKIVSFFDTGSPEGTGVQVKAVTQVVIDNLRTIEIQNTLGVKKITVRFRSKASSVHLVDCPIELTVVTDPAIACTVPVIEECVELLLLVGTPLPVELQDTASVPLVQDVVGTVGVPLTRNLLYVGIRSAIAGATAKVRVQKWAPVASAPDLAGAKVTKVADDIYLPLKFTSSSPFPGAPYQDPQRLTVAFDVLGDTALNVGYYTLEVVDGDLVSEPVLVLGPNARALQFFPTGGLGGGDSCAY